MTGWRGTSALGFCVFRIRELALLQRRDDTCQHPFEIPQYIIIPESDYFESLSFQPRRSRGVFLDVLGMLAAIHFDDQAVSQAAEVHDVVADRVLAAKLRTFQTLAAKLLATGGSRFVRGGDGGHRHVIVLVFA